MNRIISLLFVLSLLASCGQGKKKSGIDTGANPISVSEFLSDAGTYVDQTVQISGTVVHVCRQGGQRLFLVGEDGEKRIRITTGEDIAEFDVELEGEKIEVTGVVRELIIDETYLAEWEAEVLEGDEHDRGEGHEGGVGHGDQHEDSQDTEAHSEAEDHQDADDHHSTSDEHHANAEQPGAETHKATPLEEQLARIQEVRDEIATSGKDHLSDYWIETIDFKVKSE
jgi:hypothetical protein